jgi:hypothetical protein
MEVIGVGFGRTGTASLKKALEILGFGPTYHTREIFRAPRRLADWDAAVSGAEMDWDKVFDGYRSTVDWPAAAFWRELIEKYPEARVILTVREPRAWHKSCMRTIFMVYRRDLPSRIAVGLMRIPLMMANRQLRNFNPVFDGVFRRHFGSGPIDDEDYAVEVFDRHVREVKETVPADRLLVYRVEEGWPPLCKFLGVGVTFEPFPHDNDQRAFDKTVKGFVAQGLGRLATEPFRAAGRLLRGRSASAKQTSSETP